jgi:hypothetical protein
MGAPAGNKNASGSRKLKEKRFQNISTMITSVQKDGKPRQLNPRATVTLTDDDIAETRDASMDPAMNPFDLGLVAEIPAGENEHPDAPAQHKKLSAAQVKAFVTESPLAECIAAIEGLPDTGAMQSFKVALNEEHERIPVERARLIEDALDDLGGELAKQNKRLQQTYDDKFRS